MIKKLWFISWFVITFSIAGSVYKKDENIRMDDPYQSLQSVMDKVAIHYLRYNPIIVEIGTNQSANSFLLASYYPKGKIIALESNFSIYNRLIHENLYNVIAFHLDSKKMSSKEFNKWCEERDLHHADFIRIEEEKLSCFLLNKKNKLFQSALMISLRIDHSNVSSSSNILKHYVTSLGIMGFQLLSWNTSDDKLFELVFLRNDAYEIIFH